MASTWELLRRVVQPTDSTTLSTSVTASSPDNNVFAAKQYLKVHCWLWSENATTFEPDIRFGYGSSGAGTVVASSYKYRRVNNNTESTTQTNTNNRINNVEYDPATANSSIMFTMEIYNAPNSKKQVILHNTWNSTGAAYPPKRWEIVAEYGSDGDAHYINPITRIDILGYSGDAIQDGSVITVWGADDQTNVYPYLSNGTIFEETDTRIYYMWDGTDTWNRVATT